MANETISLVATLTVSSDAGNVVMSGIPQTGDDLFIIAQLGSDATQNGDGRIAVYPNNNSANMDTLWRGSLSASSESVFGTTNYYVRLHSGDVNYGPSNNQITIFNYSSATRQKPISWETSMVESKYYIGAANWRDTTPITSLGFQIRDYGTVIKVGSTISIYTIKRAI
jgi:hypothetical protein